MEQSHARSLPVLASNNDHLLQELQQLARRVKQAEQNQPPDTAQSGQGQYMIASGRS